MAAQPSDESAISPSSASSANLLRMHSPITLTLTKTLNNIDQSHSEGLRLGHLYKRLAREKKPPKLSSTSTPSVVFCWVLYSDISLLLCLQPEFARGATPSQKSHRQAAKQINGVRAHGQNTLNPKRCKAIYCPIMPKQSELTLYRKGSTGKAAKIKEGWKICGFVLMETLWLALV